MAGIAYSTRVTFRNDLGRFIADCEASARETIADIVQEGAALSISMAPVGKKADPRTTKLKNSIEPVVVSRTSGMWRATARHAMAQERGASAHTIAGAPDLAFFWEREGRDFVPERLLWSSPIGDPITTVNHPGNPAQPYLKPAYNMVWRRALQIADRNYPG